MSTTFTPTTRRRLGFGLLALVLLTWLAVAAAYFLLAPTTAQWTVMVTVAAVITEASMWIAIAWLGFSALRRVSLLAGLFGQTRKTP